MRDVLIALALFGGVSLLGWLNSYFHSRRLDAEGHASAVRDDADWNRVQQELEASPPIEQADALIIPEAAEAQREQEVEPILPKAKRDPYARIGGWLATFYGIYVVVCALFLLALCIYGYAAYITIARGTFDGQIGSLVLTIMPIFIELIVLVITFILLHRRDIRFRHTFMIFVIIEIIGRTMTIQSELTLGHQPKWTDWIGIVCVIAWSIYLFKSKRVTQTCASR